MPFWFHTWGRRRSGITALPHPSPFPTSLQWLLRPTAHRPLEDRRLSSLSCRRVSCCGLQLSPSQGLTLDRRTLPRPPKAMRGPRGSPCPKTGEHGPGGGCPPQAQGVKGVRGAENVLKVRKPIKTQPAFYYHHVPEIPSNKSAPSPPPSPQDPLTASQAEVPGPRPLRTIPASEVTGGWAEASVETASPPSFFPCLSCSPR